MPFTWWEPEAVMAEAGWWYEPEDVRTADCVRRNWRIRHGEHVIVGTVNLSETEVRAAVAALPKRY